MLKRLLAKIEGLKANKNGYIYLIPFIVRDIVETLLKDSIDRSGDTINT